MTPFRDFLARICDVTHVDQFKMIDGIIQFDRTYSSPVRSFPADLFSFDKDRSRSSSRCRSPVVVQDICPKKPLSDIVSCIDHFKGHSKSRGVEVLKATQSGADCVAFSCDGSYVAAGTRSTNVVTIGAVDKTSYKVKHVFDGHGHEDLIAAVDFHPKQPPVLVSAGLSDKTVRIWDLRGTASHTRVGVNQLNAPIAKCKYSPDGRYIIVADEGDTMTLLDGRTFGTVATIRMKDGCRDLCFHPSGKFIFMAAGNGRVDVYSVPKNLEHVKSIAAHSNQAHCNSIAISSDGSTMAVGASDSICSLWELDRLMCTRNVGRMDWPVNAVAFSYCDNLLAIGGEDRFLDISYQKTAERVAEVPLDRECIALAWHPKAYLLAYITNAYDSRERDPCPVRLFGYTKN
uniref:WD_REPEATS_REGION domain-containing protein n=2 Tax=Steinernema glaseri TaxID=37863 RepID=A0A1I8AQY9_9BILA